MLRPSATVDGLVHLPEKPARRPHALLQAALLAHSTELDHRSPVAGALPDAGGAQPARVLGGAAGRRPATLLLVCCLQAVAGIVVALASPLHIVVRQDSAGRDSGALDTSRKFVRQKSLR